MPRHLISDAHIHGLTRFPFNCLVKLQPRARTWENMLVLLCDGCSGCKPPAIAESSDMKSGLVGWVVCWLPTNHGSANAYAQFDLDDTQLLSMRLIKLSADPKSTVYDFWNGIVHCAVEARAQCTLVCCTCCIFSTVQRQPHRSSGVTTCYIGHQSVTLGQGMGCLGDSWKPVFWLL